MQRNWRPGQDLEGSYANATLYTLIRFSEITQVVHAMCKRGVGGGGGNLEFHAKNSYFSYWWKTHGKVVKFIYWNFPNGLQGFN